MQQQPYVTENGKPYEPQSKKRIITFLAIGLFVLFLIIFIIIAAVNSSKNKKCTNLEDLLASSGKKYAEANNLLPTIDGTSITIEVSTLKEKGYLKESEFSMKETPCDGSVKLTKVEDNYVATLDLTNCNYCTTSTRYKSWSKETTKAPKDQIVDVTAYYNYVEKSTYYTEWTKYYSLDEIEKNPITSIDDNRLKDIPSDAKNIEIEVDTLMYYRYRDKQWKFYKDNGGSYSNFFSSEQPEGYANKDSNTQRQTEYTEWSLNYPDKKDYRTIKETVGYRWYYKDGKNKVYWNSGAYYPTQPDEKYTEKEKESVKMYSYSDKEWRWYNGAKRQYSTYTSNIPSGYSYRDDELTNYTSWRSWITSSSLDSSNSSYREEESENRPRYRIKYDMYSFEKLEKSLTKEEFETTVGKTLQEILDTENLDLVVTYKYKSKKK